MKNLDITEEQSWLNVSLNRPSKKNSLDLSLIQNLIQVFSNIKPHIKGVALQGEGNTFCSGADLSWIQLASSRELGTLFDLLITIRDCPSPVLAHAHGSVYGGGIGLLSVCDFVSAQSQTQFCFSELKLGLMPALIAPFIMKNKPLLRQWMLSGMSFNVKTALNNGLIHFSGSSEECDHWKQTLIDQFNNLHKKSFQETKNFLNQLTYVFQKEQELVNWPYFPIRKNGLFSVARKLKQYTIKCLQKRQKDNFTQQKISSFLKK